jgi:hypothetical protein
MPILNLGLEIVCPDRGSPWFSSVYTSERRERHLEISHNHFLIHPFRFIIHELIFNKCHWFTVLREARPSRTYLKVSYTAPHVSTDIDLHHVFKNCWWKRIVCNKKRLHKFGKEALHVRRWISDIRWIKNDMQQDATILFVNYPTIWFFFFCYSLLKHRASVKRSFHFSLLI